MPDPRATRRPITRADAIRILNQLTDQDDPYWEHAVQDWYHEETDTMPSFSDLLAALGVTRQESEAAGVPWIETQQDPWPTGDLREIEADPGSGDHCLLDPKAHGELAAWRSREGGFCTYRLERAQRHTWATALEATEDKPYLVPIACSELARVRPVYLLEDLEPLVASWRGRKP